MLKINNVFTLKLKMDLLEWINYILKYYEGLFPGGADPTRLENVKSKNIAEFFNPRTDDDNPNAHTTEEIQKTADLINNPTCDDDRLTE